MLLLLAKLTEPVQIELIDERGCDWLPIVAPLVGAILIAGAAIYAAHTAARVATTNHQSQLQHDRELHREQLEHDRELHAAQLVHDRAERERAATRQTLEEVLAIAARGVQRLVALAVLVQRRDDLDTRMREATQEEPTDALDQEYAELLEEALPAIAEVAAQTDDNFAVDSRLLLRFGTEHPIVESFRRWSAASDAVTKGLTFVDWQPDTREQFQQRMSEVAAAWRDFIQLANDWANRPLTASEPPD